MLYEKLEFIDLSRNNAYALPVVQSQALQNSLIFIKNLMKIFH